MDRKVIVICASPPGSNPGMDSVDRALLYLADKHGFRDRIQRYRLYAPPGQEPVRASDVSAYALVPDDLDFFRGAAAVLYWGDFLHMRQYHETVAGKLVQLGLCENIGAARSRVAEVFLLKGQPPETLERALSFGSTLLFNTISDETDPYYGGALQKFLKSCRGVWFRDVYSAFKASLIRGSLVSSCLGVDCANLVDAEMEYPRQSRPPVENRVAIFLGRTAGNVEPMIGFGIDLARGLGCRATWLPWGDAEAFPALPSIVKVKAVRSLDGFAERPAGAFDGRSMEILSCRAVVSDTYHVCVNAWNLGVPAVCLTGNDYATARNVNFGDPLAPRDKRLVFMSMYDALHFVVPHEELEVKARKRARIEQLCELILAGHEVKEIQNRIRSHAELAEASLMHALSATL